MVNFESTGIQLFDHRIGHFYVYSNTDGTKHIPDDLSSLPREYLNDIGNPVRVDPYRHQQVLDRQDEMAPKAARYFGHPVWDITHTGYVNFPENISGLQFNPKPFNVTVYDRKVPEDPKKIRKTAGHETFHTQQPGTENLLKIHYHKILPIPLGDRYVIVLDIYFPLGRAVVEGTTESGLEETNEPKTGAYKDWYELAKKINEKVIPLRDLHNIAENEGTYAAMNALNNPETFRILDNYLIELYQKMFLKSRPRSDYDFYI